LVDKDALARLGPALDQYLECFASCAVAPTRRLISIYIRGQLGELPRKSIKPMALEAGIPPRTLQELLSLHRWDGDLLLAMLQRRVRRGHPDPRGFGFLFESRCVKKGDRTPGVARQTFATTSRPRNCVVLLHLGFSEGDFHCLLDNAVYLPESWTTDRARCEAAGVPLEMGHRTRTRIIADLLRRAEANGLPLARLVLPSESASDESFIAEVKAGGRAYAVWPSAEGRDSSPEVSTGLTPEEARQMVRAAGEARRVVQARMGEIGLDHFEVRTFRSLTRHLALSAASLLFLSEQGERSRRGRESFPIRSHG
jgi:SRSO17 transposase